MIIELTAAEVDECSMKGLRGIKFVHLNSKPLNKKSYQEILKGKLVAAVEGRENDFLFSNGHMTSGRVVIYVKCSHQTRRMGLYYEKNNHKFGQPLQLNWKLTCGVCSGFTDTSIKQKPDQLSATLLSDQTKSEEITIIDNKFDEVIEQMASQLNGLVRKIQRECLRADDPMQEFIKQLGWYGLEANTIIMSFCQNVNRDEPMTTDGPSTSCARRTTIFPFNRGSNSQNIKRGI